MIINLHFRAEEEIIIDLEDWITIMKVIKKNKNLFNNQYNINQFHHNHNNNHNNTNNNKIQNNQQNFLLEEGKEDKMIIHKNK